MGALQTALPDIQKMIQAHSAQMDQGQQKGQDEAEASQVTPVQEDIIAKLQRLKVTDPQKTLKNLIWIRRQHKQLWSTQRREKAMQALKAIEYEKGNQYIVPNPYSMSWYDPFASSAVGGSGGTEATGTEQGQSQAYIYRYKSNIIQWLDRVFKSALSAAIPRVEWWPDDADSDLDNRASRVRSRASRMIGRQNREQDLLEQALDNLFLTGSYFRYTRWSMDPRIAGFAYEDQIDWQPTPVQPNRYSCPDCGQDTPVDVNNPTGANCQGCGRPLDGSNFFPEQRVNMPVVVGQKKVPKGQVRQSVYNILHFDMDVMANFDGLDPIGNTPIGDLECEISLGALRAMYPMAWDKVKGGQTDSTYPDGNSLRDARLLAYSPSLVRNVTNQWQRPTYHRTWFQPEAFYILDKQDEAEELANIFPEGCCFASVNDDGLDIRPASLTEEWTWCGTTIGRGAYPPALAETAMDFQDRLNDIGNTIHEYNDRLACPPILYNPKMVGEALSGMFLPPGSFVPAPANPDMQRGLESAFFQPKFQMDNGIYKYADSLLLAAQLLTGITPQTYGGHQEGIDTKGGQEQALKTAMGVLWLIWNRVRGEHSEAAERGVDCLAKNASDDLYDVVQGEDAKGFKNEPIRLADLSGKARAYPEADQGYPIGYDEQRELYKELMIAATQDKTGILSEVLEDYNNQRLAMRYLAPPDMVLPWEAARDKVLEDVAALAESQPVPGLDPITGQPQSVPSVQPDADFLQKFWDLALATVTQYVLKNYQELAGTPALDNLRGYLKLCSFYSARQSAQAQLAEAGPLALPPGGGDSGPSEGAKVAPGPAPSPVAAQPQPVRPQ